MPELNRKEWRLIRETDPEMAGKLRCPPTLLYARGSLEYCKAELRDQRTPPSVKARWYLECYEVTERRLLRKEVVPQAG